MNSQDYRLAHMLEHTRTVHKPTHFLHVLISSFSRLICCGYLHLFRNRHPPSMLKLVRGGFWVADLRLKTSLCNMVRDALWMLNPSGFGDYSFPGDFLLIRSVCYLEHSSLHCLTLEDSNYGKETFCK